jgi:DNA-binding IclR family transcriptional regulator
MIQVLERAFAILSITASNPDKPVRVSDLARELGINQTTCTNIVQTLVHHGYLEPAVGSRSYVLGPEPFRLTRGMPYFQGLVETAKPYMQKLVEAVNETCLLARLGRWQKVTLCQVDRDSPFRLRLDYLEEQDPYTTATGRLLIAHLSVREREQLVRACGFPAERWDGIADAEALERTCNDVKTAECYTYAPPGSELVGIAAGVESSGMTIAALGMYLPETRFVDKHRADILEGISRTANTISDVL